MSERRFELANGFSVASLSMRDQAACVEHLYEKEIYDRTARIPWPYTEQHAHDWLLECLRAALRGEEETVFAIRDPGGRLIGAAGLSVVPPPHEHSAEIGYWVAKTHWGRGLATGAVGQLVSYGFQELGLCRLFAHVFSFNTASMRVLEKNGFEREGCLRHHFRKDGVLIDAVVFGLVAGAP